MRISAQFFFQIDESAKFTFEQIIFKLQAMYQMAELMMNAIQFCIVIGYQVHNETH